MNKYKVIVYAICKNEEKFVERWFNSMKEADKIVVLDTGSTDNTVKKLKEHGISVFEEIISPWRFDVARNKSLDFVDADADICVCTDLDEIFESGWRKKLEESWQPNTKQLRYKYVWNMLPNGGDGVTFLYEKIHARQNFKWIYPVHEVLNYSGATPLNTQTNENIILRHYADQTKSRGQYLGLLELSVKEHPESDRNTHYLAREYMFYSKYKEAIKYFKKHLKMKSSTWDEERSASCRYLGDCYLKLNKIKLAERYYKQAILECSRTREPFLSLATFYYQIKDYLLCSSVLDSLFLITQKSLSYITNPDCFSSLPYDLKSMCCYYLNSYQKAVEFAKKALELEPKNERIKSNLNYFLKKI